MARAAESEGKSYYAPVEKLRPHPQNDNHQSPMMFGKLLATIRSEGFSQPIVVRSGNSKGAHPDGMLEILGGEQRWRAAGKLKMAKVPVFDLGVVDDQRARKLIINLNKLHGESDQDALSRLVREIVAEGGTDALESLPFNEDDIRDLLDDDAAAALGDEPGGPEGDGPVLEHPTVDLAGALSPRDLLLVLGVYRLPQAVLADLVEAAKQWAFGRDDQNTPAHLDLAELLRANTKQR